MEITQEQMNLFHELIALKSGIHLDRTKLDSLKLDLLARIKGHNCKCFGEYYHLLKSSEKEFHELISMITVNETSFFRNPLHFNLLRSHILPEFIKKREAGERRINIWSAGCSTGEEPYSIAMVLLDALDFPSTWQIEILATDIDKEALVVAQKGIYRRRSLRFTDRKLIDRFFSSQDGNYRLSEEVRQIINLRYFNLVNEPYPLPEKGEWDIIFCRNVIIYLNPKSAQKVIRNFYRSLDEGGYLFLGYSESLQGISDEFSLVEIGGCFIHKKSEGAGVIPSKEEVKPKPELLPEAAPVEDAQTFYEEAVKYIQKDELDSAIKKIGRALEIKPDHTMANFFLGKIYADQKIHSQAVERCKKILDADPLFAQAHFLLGVVYKEKEMESEAIEEFKKAIYIDKDFALAHLSLANLYQAQKKNREAVREYKNTLKALQGRPKDEIMEFSGGFTNELLIESCRKRIRQMEQGSGEGSKRQDLRNCEV